MPNCDHLAHVPHYVYRVFDAEGRLLYVGCTVNPLRRARAHRRSDWFMKAATFTLLGPFVGRNARTRAMTAEARIIRDEVPVVNVKRHMAVLHSERRTTKAA